MNRMWRQVAILVLITAGIAQAAGRFPWHRRIGKEVDSIHITAHKNTPIGLWPREPDAPKTVDPDRFKQALSTLCPNISSQRQARYADLILSESKRFGVNPFLLGALVYDQSQCWPHTPKREIRLGRYGMTRIPHVMHAPHIRKGVYTYYVLEDGRFTPRTLPVDQYPYNVWTVRKPASNLYFAAAILSVLKAQAVDLDTAFEGVDHRHYVSHWFYGDRVTGVEPENRVLRARRRLISYYNKAPVAGAGSYMGNALVSPLDGVPRLVLDYFGNPRGKKGTRGHRGIDIDATEGEPVRAVTAGRVTFAGVDLLGANNHRQLTPEEAAALEPEEMGPGGLYVSLNHKNHFGTIYMHLKSLAVAYGDQVTKGQTIGTAGRSGAKKSGPHLHLEFRVGTDRTDPAALLDDVLVNPYKDKKKKNR